MTAMGNRSGISWTDATWNPIRGCSRVSEGCRHCYAESMAARIIRMGNGKPTLYDGLVRLARITTSQSPATTNSGDPEWIENKGGDRRSFAFGVEPHWTGEVVFDEAKLADPLSWKKPRRIFVNSMSDLFHERLTNERIAAVFGVMAACPQHTFIVLTKRSRRMREWFAWAGRLNLDQLQSIAYRAVPESNHAASMAMARGRGTTWPLPNVWIGVSVENQDAADKRIPDLLATPATVRLLSCEPLLDDLNLALWLGSRAADGGYVPGIDWVIAGCESGPGARLCDVAWLRSLRDQCAQAGVPLFLKQAKYIDGPRGTRSPIDAVPPFADLTKDHGSRRKPGGVIELPYLDGVQHAEMPRTRST